MTSDQRLRIREDRRQSPDRFLGAQVAKRHGHVSQQAPALWTLNGASLEPRPKLFVVERKERDQFRRVQALTGLESELLRGPDIDIIRAGLLADIAAKDVIADQRPYLCRSEEHTSALQS